MLKLGDWLKVRVSSISLTMNLINQKFSYNEINEVMGWISLTPNIIFYSQSELVKLSSKNVIKLYKETSLVGCCVVKEINPQFEEIAILINKPNFYGCGYGTILFGEGVSQINSRGRSIFTTTRNSKVIHMANQHNFVSVRFREIPLNLLLKKIIYVFHFGRIRESIRKFIAFGKLPRFQNLIKFYQGK